MSDTKTASWIAALERAKTELERGLSADEPGRAARAATGDADWAGYEPALGANPVYRCWAQLNEAIEELRHQAQVQAQVQAPAEAGATPAHRRVSLRDVLEHIRGDPAPFQGAEPHAPSGAADRSAPYRAAPSGLEPPSTSSPSEPTIPPLGAGHLPPEAEEATVSFVIRERVQPTPVAGQGGNASAPKQPAPAGAPAASEPEVDLGAEAEVVIVPQRR